MENEGLCADAATYVKLNKKIDVPAEKVPEDLKKKVGQAWFYFGELIFVDREGNIARADLKFDKIASIPKGVQDPYKVFLEELKSYGFKIETRIAFGLDWPTVAKLRLESKKAVEEAIKNSTKREFDF